MIGAAQDDDVESISCKICELLYFTPLLTTHINYFSFCFFVTPLYQFRSFRLAHSVVCMSRSSRRGQPQRTKECPTLLQVSSFGGGARSVYHTVLPPPGNLSLHLTIQIPFNLEPHSCILCLWTILLPLQRDRFLPSIIDQSLLPSPSQ